MIPGHPASNSTSRLRGDHFVQIPHIFLLLYRCPCAPLSASENLSLCSYLRNTTHLKIIHGHMWGENKMLMTYF